MLFYMVGPLQNEKEREFYLGHYLEPRVFTKGRYIRLIFSKEKREATLYRSENKIFLSIVERKILSC